MRQAGIKRFSFKKILFSTHMFLGLIFCVTISIIGITGALYSYADEIGNYERARYASSIKTADAKTLNIEEISAKFLEQKPNASIRFLRVSNVKEGIKNIGISAVENDKYAYYEFDQFTGKIITLGLKSDKFFRAVMMLHRFLSFENVSTTGKNVVAITTITIIILSITGIFLYFPMLKRNFLKSIRVDFKAKGHKFLYQLHCAFGAVTSIFVLTMCLSGLWWSYEWYRNLLNELAGVETASFSRSERKEMQTPTPKELQDVVDTAFVVIKDSLSYYISVPFKGEPYELSYTNTKYGAYNLLKINARKIVSHELYEDKTAGQKLLQNIYALHSGQFFGETGKALWCISSLSMALFSISGAMMFYKKMKRKSVKAKESMRFFQISQKGLR
jgi:sulfite reductase (NADPH) flavoprotein alpha-component